MERLYCKVDAVLYYERLTTFPIISFFKQLSQGKYGYSPFNNTMMFRFDIFIFFLIEVCNFGQPAYFYRF